MKRFNKNGFTLMEVLLTIGIISVLSTVLYVGLNPRRQFAKARDAERETDLVAILSSVTQYQAEHSGALPDTDGDPETSNFPTTPTCIGTGVGCFDLAGAGEAGDEIVPVYMAAMPMDPDTAVGSIENTGYLIHVDENDRIVASATPETKESIERTQ